MMSRLLHARSVGLLVGLMTSMAIVGCRQAPKREPRSIDRLFAERKADDEARAKEGTAFMDRLLVHLKSKCDAAKTSGATTQPSLDILVISGGGDWGAFGAGILKGWRKVAGDMARPQFDVVTGVSTGALIAPFAFLGDDASIEAINHLYRHPKKDWVKSRGVLYFWPSNPSFFSLPGLERDLKKEVNRPLLERISSAGSTGRTLIINTTNVDFGDMHAWDLVAETNRALAANDERRIVKMLLASAGIPGIFPSQSIGECLYVDGAITGNILYGGRVREDQSLPALWQAKYPGVPMPRVRYWVIFNNQLRFPPQVTQQRWPDIIGRASIMGTQTATVNSMRHLFAQAEISRLKRKTNIEVRIIAVPDDWICPEPGSFKPKVMNTLADMGEQLGADPKSWRTEPP